MSRILKSFNFFACAAVATVAIYGSAPAQEAKPEAKPPAHSTVKVDGTDNVYAFTYGNRVSMFIVTRDGVIATDPGGYGQPQRVPTYLAEIKKVTDKPVKYLVYSHHHYDHISGGQAFKDAGATIVAHARAKERLELLGDPSTPLPDETFTRSRTIRLGGTALELTYHGLNHSDSTIAMRLPKEKILFVVDLIPVGSVPGRGMIDFFPLEAEKSMEEILALDWNVLIPGHPGAPGGRFGTKADVQAQLQFLRDASETVKVAAREGKCWDEVEKGVKLPKYESWPGYQSNLQFVLRRYCGLWGRGT
jgi:glyoxylase-like metal-dependent hydrolase (beta-lactamase superfamily II)